MQPQTLVQSTQHHTIAGTVDPVDPPSTATWQRGSCEWYEFMKLPDVDSREESIDLRFPAEQCPDVIFYLVEKHSGFDFKNNVISYLRFSWPELLALGFSTPPKWYTFKLSPVLHKMGEEDFPGTILLGLRAGADPLEELQKEKAKEERELSVSASMSASGAEDKPLLTPRRKRTAKLSAGETMGQLQVTVGVCLYSCVLYYCEL